MPKTHEEWFDKLMEVYKNRFDESTRTFRNPEHKTVVGVHKDALTIDTATTYLRIPYADILEVEFPDPSWRARYTKIEGKGCFASFHL